MRVSILQPGYLPWLGFFEQVYKSDVFVIYDDVQYDKHGWRNRNKIKTARGIQWLTVPVLFSLKKPASVKDVKIDNAQDWQKKHFLSVKQSYSNAPFFNKYFGILEEAYLKRWEYLLELDIYFIMRLSECLGMSHKNIVLSSTLNVKGDRIEKLINICKIFKADIFYEGAAGKNYIPDTAFAMNGINVDFQDYKHPVYHQLYGEFAPYLSVIDLLFNHGEESVSILTGKKFHEVNA